MRQRRHRDQWFAVALGQALLFVISGSAGAQSASPDPSTSVDPSPSPSATDAPSASPTAAPSPSPGFVCDIPFAQPEGSVVRGETVRVRFDGFPPSAVVTLIFDSWVPELVGPIGTSVADASGRGIVDGVIPNDAPIGETSLHVVADECAAYTYVMVLGSEAAVSVDDATVVAGQRVTVRAGGFEPNANLLLSIDSAPTQGECFPHPCHYLGDARASDLGSAVFNVRIPRNTSPGKHSLWVSGYTPDGLTEVSVGVDITVVGGNLPSTDTASVG